MARVGIPTAKISILLSCQEFLQLSRGFSRFARAVDDEPVENFLGSLKAKKNSKDDSFTWVPHPRSGIYFPEGQEQVMEDIPKGAASLNGRTFWLRNDDDQENLNTEE